ncbi:MAG: hypothetical protein GX622_03510 [Bacteroidales bacterium]|nr:hypothetical protein [Bacteroidales bacterium]
MHERSNKNKSKLAYVLDTVDPLIQNFGVEILASNFAWSIVLGVLPCEGSENEKMAMELNRRDTTIDKVENIARLTVLGKALADRPDYSDSNITEFTLAVRQLLRYTAEDATASAYLKDLKFIYISFITSYYYQSVKFGKKEEALKILAQIANGILAEDEKLKNQIINIMNYKPLN